MRHLTTQHVAANVRAELARRNISGRSLALALGWTASSTARRLSGATPLTVDDLSQIAAHIGVAPAHLMSEYSAVAS